MNSESRNDEIGDFVSNSVKSLYNILQQSKDMSLSIIVGGSEADNKHSSPFLLMEGTLDGEHYRIISFGDSVDASPNYFTGDSGDSISFEPKTIMISTYPEEFADELPEVKSMPDAFIGLSSGTGNYVLSYSDLELGDDSVYYDSTRITDDGVESSKIDVDLRSGKGSGPDPSVQKTLNVEEYTKSKVSNTIDRIKWILGGRITVPEGNIHEEIDPEK